MPAGFIVIHVTLVVLTGFVRNMNHIVLGKDDLDPLGMWLGLTGIGVVILTWVIAHKVAWKQPRKVQHLHKAIAMPILLTGHSTIGPFINRKVLYRMDPSLYPNHGLAC